MEYIKALPVHAEDIHNLVQNTIKTVYSKYYPKEVVNFFCKHHSIGNINADITNGNTYILLNNNIIVGTGSVSENHITRVFVSTDYQGMGFGSFIMNHLETEINRKYRYAVLDSSLYAGRFYQHRGYKTIGHEQIEVENGKILAYEIMQKELNEQN